MGAFEEGFEARRPQAAGQPGRSPLARAMEPRGPPRVARIYPTAAPALAFIIPWSRVRLRYGVAWFPQYAGIKDFSEAVSADWSRSGRGRETVRREPRLSASAVSADVSGPEFPHRHPECAKGRTVTRVVLAA